jgi:hypothetical protein
MGVMPEIRISTDKVCELAEALRELAGVEDRPPGGESDEGDDSIVAFLEESDDDPRPQEISEMIRGLTEDERIDLVALVLVGREDFSLAEWGDAVASASDRIEEGGPDFAAAFISEDMASAEFLEAGLRLFGRDCADWDSETVGMPLEDRANRSAVEEGNASPDTGDIADTAQGQEPGVPPNLDRHVARGLAAGPDPALAAAKPPTRKP